MTNPTSNFGWQMPTPTDLVTDLPADFEVFGQAVDTSLADLKGGTTGQVLKKNTNTDMDFVWSADSGILPSNFTAKGDLLVGTGSGTFVAQGVGTNGQVLTANSAQSDGVEWTTLSAGGMTLISTTTMSGSTVTLSSIPTTYKHLLVSIVGGKINVDTNNGLLMRLNGDSGSNYNYASFSITGSSVGAETQSGVSFVLVGNIAPNSASGRLLHSSMTWLPNYTNTSGNQFYSTQTYSSRTSSQVFATTSTGNYAKSAAITSITFDNGSPFSAGTIYLYGVS
jgi:hypothetical protein